MNNTYVIDGTNICWWFKGMGPNTMSVKPLLTIIKSILENGDNFYCVFDANTAFHQDGKVENADAIIIEALLEEDSKRFFRVTGQTRADGTILHAADHSNLQIISNDLYRDYADRYSWLAEKYTSRLIRGNLQPNGLMTLERLPYGNMELIEDAQAAFEHINVLLSIKNSSALTELDQILKQRQKQIEQAEDRLQQLTAEIAAKEARADTIQASEEELQTKREDLDAVSSELKRLHNIRDFSTIEAQIDQKISSKTAELLALEGEIGERERYLTTVCQEAKPYKLILDQQDADEKARQRSKQDDQECIQKANTEIAAFMEPYQLSRTYDTIDIPFKGSSWDVAVKALQIFFDKNVICVHCYNIPVSGVVNEKCPDCSKGMLTNRPVKILDIIRRNTPITANPIKEHFFDWVFR